MPKRRQIIVIAGPNGAGKTTFAREYLLNEANCPDFINVDLIAAGLSPFDPDRAVIQAGRLMLSEIERRVRKGQSFAFETTLSGQGYARIIPEWRRAGYRVRLIFLSLPSAEMAVARVAMRVAQGGHNVASAVVRRRFDSGLRNFHHIYKGLVDGNGTIVQALFHDSHREEETLGNDGSQSRVTVTRGRRHVARPEAGGETGARTRTENRHACLRNGKWKNRGPHEAKTIGNQGRDEKGENNQGKNLTVTSLHTVATRKQQNPTTPQAHTLPMHS